MLIESDARKPIKKAIELEKEIRTFEAKERLKGKVVLNCEAYHDLRRQLVEIVCQLNSVANTEGKGRDDLTYDILLAAEGISRRISSSQSTAVRMLADEIKKAFTNIRMLMRKYDENIEVVDPQLKNNPELVQVLVPFEKSWEKGKEFLLRSKICNMLVYFSQLIEGAKEKYKEFQDKIDSVDTEIFIIVPCIAVLNSLNGNDKGLCKTYYPAIDKAGPERDQYESLKGSYEKLKTEANDGYKLYNILEQAIFDMKIDERIMKKCGVTQAEISSLVHEIKGIAMEMQRHSPTDWNTLMETAMGHI
jgi:hypothetical protein